MKRKQFVISTIIILLLALFAGCKQSFSPALKKADQVLSADTEKGSKMLDSICQAEPNMSTANQRYYQLLKLKASDKDYQPITNQKLLIDSLVSYFEHAGEDNLLAEAYFYAGRVYYEIGDKPEALKFYQKANEKVAKDNYALQGDIYCQMANVYRYTDLNKEALAALRLAYQADSLSGNIRNMLYDIRDMGEVYLGQNNILKAQKNFSLGVEKAKKNKDTLLLLLFHHGLAVAYNRKDETTKALSHINYCINNINILNDKNGVYVTALDIYTKNNNKKLANIYRNAILDFGNITSKRYALENLLKEITSKDAITNKYFKKFTLYDDSVQKLKNCEATKKAEQLYQYNLKERENTKLKAKNHFKNISIIIAFFFLLIIFFSFQMKIKNMKQEQELLKHKNDKLKQLEKLAELKTQAKLNSEQNSIGTSKIQNTINKEIKEGTYKLSEEGWRNLKILINSTYPEFDKNLEAFLCTNPVEYKICLMIKLGVTPSNIAKFVNVTKEAITASRRRMYIKVFKKKGTPSDWDKVILSL